MDVEKAIKIALEYENKVRDVYIEASNTSKSETGKKVYNQRAAEEQGHVDYLESRLKEWQKTGKITAEKIKTTIRNT